MRGTHEKRISPGSSTELEGEEYRSIYLCMMSAGECMDYEGAVGKGTR